MRDPQEGEWIRCPKARSQRTYKPKKVFDHGGQGVLDSHRHGIWSPECDHSGLPAPIVRENKTKKNE